MNNFSDINLWAVLLAAISDMIIGSLWYSPVLFYKSWITQLGKTQKEIDEKGKKGLGTTVAGAFLSALVMAYVLAHILKYLDANTPSGALEGAFWLWLGFMFAGSYGHYFFPGRTFQLYLIDKSYDLVKIIVMALILVLWK